MSKSPIVYIIAGPNGSGKTTFATKFLPTVAKCDEFVNADLIAQGLSPLSPQSVRIEAGRILLNRITALANARANFGFETTFSGKAYLHRLRKLKSGGYEIHIIFLWLRTVELALKRIADRVKQGGHDIPEKDVRRRYETGLRHFFSIYRPLAGYFALLDNSTETPQLIATGDSRTLEVGNDKLFAQIKQKVKGVEGIQLE